MDKIIFPASIIIIAFVSIFYGFRKGITHQIPSLLGVTFGAVAVRVFIPEYSIEFHNLIPVNVDKTYFKYIDNFISSALLYSIVYFLSTFFFGVFSKLISILGKGILNRITGAVFSLFKNFLWLSLLFNLLLCLNPNSILLNYEKSDDGNIVSGVLEMTHAVIGCPGAEYLVHLVQLKDASTIS